MATDDVQTNLRIPADLKDRLQASAESAGRSLSAEVAYRIARSFELEKVIDTVKIDIEGTQQALKRISSEIATKDRELSAATRQVAALEAQVDLLKNTRESDIAAATQFLTERIDFLSSRAGSAEREARDLRGTIELQQQISKLLGYSLKEASTFKADDSPGVRRLKEGLSNIGISLWNGNIKDARSLATELAFSPDFAAPLAITEDLVAVGNKPAVKTKPKVLRRSRKPKS